MYYNIGFTQYVANLMLERYFLSNLLQIIQYNESEG